MRGFPVAVMVVLATLGAARAQAEAPCDASTQFTYTFTNHCTDPIWIGQRSKSDPASHPPRSGNWAISGRCQANTECGAGVCDADSGLCTCTTSADCSGGAPCGADGKCVATAVFCMPQVWNSGTFWPRTGCVPNTATSPEQLSCATGDCYTTDGSGLPLLDCSVDNGGGSPTNPVSQFEVTSNPPNLNYDVSIAAGYNVETRVTPVGGAQILPAVPASEPGACYTAGCVAELNAACPAALQELDGPTVVGCLDPCTRCQRANPPASLQCTTSIGQTYTDCDGNTGPVTYQDLYCAKNMVDGNPQASPNQGTPTAFSALDCPPLTSFVVPTFTSGYTLPPGQGFCLYTSPPQSTQPHQNDYGWADAASGTTKNCGGLPPDYTALADGTPCGGYLTTQSDGGYYVGALGYTCQEAQFPVAGGSLTAHLCVPPTTQGLGTCTKTTAGGLPLYEATGGVPNASWIAAGVQAGGGTTPYYETFKTACPSAYAWQYDDIAGGWGCSSNITTAGGQAFSGFAVDFCASTGGGGGGDGGGGTVPTAVVRLDGKGRAAKLGRDRRGVLRVRGRTTIDPGQDLKDVTLVVTDLLDEVGATGELVGDAGLPRTMTARRQKPKVAIFESDPGVTPRIKVVLHRPHPKRDKVRVLVLARRATIARPSGCTSDGETVSLETSVTVATTTFATRVGAVGTWRCRRDAVVER
jgi:hypothetical protein